MHQAFPELCAFDRPASHLTHLGVTAFP